MGLQRSLVATKARGGSPDTCRTWHGWKQAGSELSSFWQPRRVATPSLDHLPALLVKHVSPSQDASWRAVSDRASDFGDSSEKAPPIPGRAGVEPRSLHTDPLTQPLLRLLRSCLRSLLRHQVNEEQQRRQIVSERGGGGGRRGGTRSG